MPSALIDHDASHLGLYRNSNGGRQRLSLRDERQGRILTVINRNGESSWINPDTGEVMLGDIIISVDKVLEQAQSYGHSPKREFAFLIVHSMLHLFGYDHIDPKDAAIMEPKQKQILEEMHIVRD